MLFYCLQVTGYTGLFCLIYILLLRNKVYHAYSRAFLLFASALPLLLPFLHLPAAMSIPASGNPVFGAALPGVTLSVQHSLTGFSDLPVALIVYLLVSLVLVGLLVFRLVRLYAIIRHNEAEVKDGYTLIKHTKHGPGSWGRFIFIPEGDVPAMVLAHEQRHVRLHHTADVLWMSLLQVVCWPNVFLYWIGKELRQVHEFQADEVADKEKTAYATLLVSSLFHCGTAPLMHSFIIHPIKRRIMMLQKQNRKDRGRVAIPVVVASILLAGSLVTVQSCKRNSAATAVATAPVPGTKIISSTDKNGIYTSAEVMPQFPGNIMDFIAKNIVYPASAKARGIQGRVLARFIVNEQGKVVVSNNNTMQFSVDEKGTKHIVPGSLENSVILRSPDPELSAAVIDMLKKMPDWKPGMDKGKPVSVYYTIPVSFKLD